MSWRVPGVRMEGRLSALAAGESGRWQLVEPEATSRNLIRNVWNDRAAGRVFPQRAPVWTVEDGAEERR